MTISVHSVVLTDIPFDQPLNDYDYPLPLKGTVFGREYDLVYDMEAVDGKAVIKYFAFTIYGLRVFVLNHWSVAELTAIADRERMENVTPDDEQQEAWFSTLFYQLVMTDSTIMPKLVDDWRNAGIQEGHRRHGLALKRLMEGEAL